MLDNADLATLTNRERPWLHRLASNLHPCPDYSVNTEAPRCVGKVAGARSLGGLGNAATNVQSRNAAK